MNHSRNQSELRQGAKPCTKTSAILKKTMRGTLRGSAEGAHGGAPAVRMSKRGKVGDRPVANQCEVEKSCPRRLKRHQPT